MRNNDFFVLGNGVRIPKIGFGTWQIKNGEDAYIATLNALKIGYRHIDTAYAYGNEESIARAIKDSKIKREELFITTKLPANIKNYEETLEYFNRSIKALGLDYIDLYLIHAPWPWTDVGNDYSAGNVAAWKAMIKLYEEKKIRAIGVSNFNEREIVNLIENTSFKPLVNQIRFFIGNTQEEITSYCQRNNILVEAYSPLATGEIVENENLKSFAQKYGVTIPQICIRYCLQKQTLPLPKASSFGHIKENFDLDFIIEKNDMDYLDSLSHIGSVKPFRS